MPRDWRTWPFLLCLIAGCDRKRSRARRWLLAYLRSSVWFSSTSTRLLTRCARPRRSSWRNRFPIPLAWRQPSAAERRSRPARVPMGAIVLILLGSALPAAHHGLRPNCLRSFLAADSDWPRGLVVRAQLGTCWAAGRLCGLPVCALPHTAAHGPSDAPDHRRPVPAGELACGELRSHLARHSAGRSAASSCCKEAHRRRDIFRSCRPRIEPNREGRFLPCRRSPPVPPVPPTPTTNEVNRG